MVWYGLVWCGIVYFSLVYWSRQPLLQNCFLSLTLIFGILLLSSRPNKISEKQYHFLKKSTMARLAGWKYNNQTNCYVKPNYTDYPPLPATTMNTSSNAKRQLKVKIKTEASTKRNDLAHPRDTRYKNKETTKILMFTYSPLRLPSQNRTLALLNSTVQSPSKPPPTKKSRNRKHIVDCCIYGPKSMCSAKKYVCFSKRRSCIACK